jgi:hypothetical protein
VTCSSTASLTLDLSFEFLLVKTQRKVSQQCIGPAGADTGEGLSE